MVGLDAHPRKKLALLVGINSYPHLRASQQLRGCLNDVALMAETLEKVFGFSQEQMTFLRNEQATRDNILDAMNALLTSASTDDIVVFYYSGHGSRVRDREGDEVDGWDETIMPYDSGRSPHLFRDITDDEIYLWLVALTQKTPFVTLIFDSCYSGDITRDSFGDTMRGLEAETRPLQELPPSPIHAEQLPLLLDGMREVGSSGWLPRGQRHVLIAGCRHDENSYETAQGALIYGAMTYALNQELLHIVPNTTYRDAFELMSLRVSSRTNDRQHPQMEGARDREIFGVRDITPLRFVSVKERKGQTVLLAAGQAHGLTAGSQWAIYQRAAKNTLEASSRLGLVEIRTLYGVTAEARILSEAYPEAIAVLARAVEIVHNYDDMRLRIHLDEEATGQLKRLLVTSSSLQVVETQNDAQVQIYLVQPRAQVHAFDPIPQLGAISEATWAVVGRTGQLVLPPYRQREPGAVSILLDNLEKMARYNNILNLQNLGSQDILCDKLTMSLLKRKPDGSWIEAAVDPERGYMTYYDGDAIAIRIINHHSTPVYCCILDMGLTGTITQLYPEPGANKALNPGHPLLVGVRPGDEIQLYIPMSTNTGTSFMLKEQETFKLIATTREADFSLFAQDHYRGETVKEPEIIQDPFSQLLEMAWTGTRETARPLLKMMDTWTTVEKSFLLLPAH